MTQRTRIKICGMTRAHDARHAVACGVDALGFIFVEQSPRYIEPDQARDIIASLPPFVDAVGVFMDADADLVEEIIHYCGLTMVQLHGQESPEYCRQISARVLKGFRISAERLATGLVDFGPYFGAVEGFLLDAYNKGQAGGTGEVFDWQLVEHNQPPCPQHRARGLSAAGTRPAGWGASMPQVGKARPRLMQVRLRDNRRNARATRLPAGPHGSPARLAASPVSDRCSESA